MVYKSPNTNKIKGLCPQLQGTWTSNVVVSWQDLLEGLHNLLAVCDMLLDQTATCRKRRQLHCVGYDERRARLNTHQMFRCLGHVWTRIFPYRGGNESLALCGTSRSYMECNIMNHVLRQEKQATDQLVLAASDTGSHDDCAEPPSLNASVCTLTHFSDTYQLIPRSTYWEISPLFANSRSSIAVIVQG